MRRLHRNLLVFTIALIPALVLGEFAVRRIAPQPTMLQSAGMYISDPDLGYRLNPGHQGFLGNRVEYRTRINVNSNGLRGENLDADCRFRILVIGDSFVFGQGVEASKAIATKLQEYLQARGIPAHVMNGGVPGYGTVQEVAWLRKYGISLRPDIVVIGVFMGNDILDNLTAPGDPDRSASVDARQSAMWWRHNPLTEWLYENSHLYVLLRELPQFVKLRRTSMGFINLKYLSQAYPATEGAPNTDALRKTRQAVDEFAHIDREAGAEPVALLIPDFLQVARERPSLVNQLARQGTHVDFDYPRRIFTDLFARNHVKLLDLTDRFREAINEGKQLYYPVDRHWNTAGHDFAASLLAEPVRASLEEISFRRTGVGTSKGDSCGPRRRRVAALSSYSPPF